MNATRFELMNPTFKHLAKTCLRAGSHQPLLDYGKHLKDVLPQSEKPKFRKEYLNLHKWLSEALQKPLPAKPKEKGTIHWWNNEFMREIQLGTKWDVMSKTPTATRDLLQTCKMVGGQLCALHPAPLDPTPRHMRTPALMKQFGCDAATAKTLHTFFALLDADSTMINTYAKEAKQRGLPTVWLELRKWAAVVLKEDTRVKDALRHTLETLTDTDGTDRHTTLAFQPLYGSPWYDPERNDPSSEPSSEIDETPDLFQETERGYETVAYHRIPSDDDPEPPQKTHPLVQKVASCKREQLPQLKKQLWELQQQGHISHDVVGAIWREAELTTLRKAPLFLQSACRRLHYLNHKDLAKLGQLMFKRGHDLTSSERKLFWTAYKTRKAALNPAAPVELQPSA